MFESLIVFAASNFALTFLVIALIAAAISLLTKPKPLTRNQVVEAVFSYVLLIGFGFNYFYNFIMHVFFGDMAAQFIGWAQSPFQAEVGFASLGFAIANILAFRASWPFRAAAIIGPAFFYWGAALGHIYQMITAHNFAPGNVGVALWADIFLPVLGFGLLWLQKRYPKPGSRRL